MPSKQPQVAKWLSAILKNVSLAQSFAGELNRAAFCADTVRVYGVTRCLEIISEASRRLPDDLKARHPSIAWKEMAGAGSVYRRDYEVVDADEVWVTVQDHLPPLRAAAEAEIMDDAERLAKRYLDHCGYGDIRYEPDGKIPPDFLVDGRIAIEVRRLNRSFDEGSGPDGLETSIFSLASRVGKLLSKLGPPTRGESWFVSYTFSRPLVDWRVLRPTLKKLLKEFMARTDPKEFDHDLCGCFRLEVCRASKACETFFVLGGLDDEHSGGLALVLSEIEANLKVCISEKGEKIRKIRSKYPEWWLVLSDHIGHGLSSLGQTKFRDQISLDFGLFDQVILLNPHNHLRSFAI